MRLEKKTISIGQLPVEIGALYDRKDRITLDYGAGELSIRRFRTKSNVADINGDLYYFGNTLSNVNPYKNVKSLEELEAFLSYVNSMFDSLVHRVLTDVTYLNVSQLMSSDIIAEKLLTTKHVTYPDYTVELHKRDSNVTIEINQDEGIIKTESKLIIKKVGHFELSKLFKMEYLNSLYIVKLAHKRDLDISGSMNLVRQLVAAKRIDVISIANNQKHLSIALHIPEKIIPEVFGYKLKRRLMDVRLDDLTSIFTSQLIKLVETLHNNT